MDFKSKKIVNTHTDWVSCLAFSPCGKFLVYGSDDSKVYIWNLETNTCAAILYGHKGAVYGIAINPSGTLIASTSKDKTIIMWKLQPPHASYKLVGHRDFVVGGKFSPDGSEFASVSWDCTVRIWKGEKNCNVFVGHDNYTKSIDYFPNGKRLVSLSDGQCCVWCRNTGEMVHKISKNEQEHFTSVEISKKQKTVVISSWFEAGSAYHTRTGGKGKITIYDGETFDCIASFEKKLVVEKVRVSNDECMSLLSVFDGCFETNIYLLQKQFQNQTRCLIGSEQIVSHVVDMQFSPRGDQIAFSFTNNDIYVYTLLECKFLARFSLCLLRKNVATYIILDIVNLLAANHNEISFQTESEHLRFRKANFLTLLNNFQKNLKNVKRI